MKSRKHRHKESFSLLLISNTGQNTRHFHITSSFMRLFTVFVLCICAAFGWLMYQYLSNNEITSTYVNASEGTSETEQIDQMAEQDKVAEQDKLVQQLEEEIESLNRLNSELTSENKALLAAAKLTKDAETADEAATEGNPEADPAYPSRYPYSGTGVMFERYSESHPYVSIEIPEEGDVIATGNGTIDLIDSDNTYSLIIEIEHGNGYKTRYMFPQDAEPLLAEGAQVLAGTALVPVDINNVQLDYQVIYEEEPIDPVIVFEVKG